MSAYLSFVVFAALLATAPGPDTFLTLRASVVGGRARGLATAQGHHRRRSAAGRARGERHQPEGARLQPRGVWIAGKAATALTRPSFRRGVDGATGVVMLGFATALAVEA